MSVSAALGLLAEDAAHGPRRRVAPAPLDLLTRHQPIIPLVGMTVSPALGRSGLFIGSSCRSGI